MPPATLRAFGFETVAADEDPADESRVKQAAVDAHGVNAEAEAIAADEAREKAAAAAKSAKAGKTDLDKLKRIYKGLGKDIGAVTLPDGTTVPGGRLLVRDSWNAKLYPSLEKAYEEGQSAAVPDVWIHKNRMSGLWGASTPCTSFLEEQGIKTLLFAGVNTDQCVGGSMQDAFSKGWDTIMLNDGCGTTSKDYARQCVEFNCAHTWGFVTGCEDFAKGVEGMVK